MVYPWQTGYPQCYLVRLEPNVAVKGKVRSKPNPVLSGLNYLSIAGWVS